MSSSSTPGQALKSTGLRTGDPRLKECMEMLKVTLKTTSDGALDRHLFKKWVFYFWKVEDEFVPGKGQRFQMAQEVFVLQDDRSGICSFHQRT